MIAFAGCEDIEDNTPGLQASKDNDLFRALDVSALINDDGTIAIIGLSELEKLVLTVTSKNVGTYVLGGTSANKAVFDDISGLQYTSNPDGEGEVVISRYDEINGTITGTFRVVVFSNSVSEPLTLHQGVFFEVPIVGGGIIDPDSDFVDTFSAVVNGREFDPTLIASLDAGGFILVTGAIDTTIMGIRFPSTTGPGVYSLADDEFSATYAEDGATVIGVTGELDILSHDFSDNTITARFNFETETTDGIIVTEGEFSVQY